jgi:hypothetical protein
VYSIYRPQKKKSSLSARIEGQHSRLRCSALTCGLTMETALLAHAAPQQEVQTLQRRERRAAAAGSSMALDTPQARLTFGLFVVFGVTSWITINGVFAQLPLLVTDLPEGESSLSPRPCIFEPGHVNVSD